MAVYFFLRRFQDGQRDRETYIGLGAPNTAWFINGKLIYVTRKGAAFFSADFSQYGSGVYSLEYKFKYNSSPDGSSSGSGGFDWGNTDKTLGAVGILYDGLENAVANKYWWMDAKGNYKSTNILKIGENGKYVRGVQGLRNGYNSALKAANGYKVAGNVVGVIGLGVTYMQYSEGQISGTEASIDAAFGVIGFLGPIGAGISATYFIGKLGYEYFSGNTLFEKPQ